ATTMWERWNSFSKEGGYNSQSMNSLNHYAYGAIGQWMYERIAGLASLAPGYQKIRIAPLPNTEFLTSASASVKTPYGKASSSWKIENDSFKLAIVIPPNTTALVSIPTTNSNNVEVNGVKISKNQIIDQKEDELVIEVSAGTYNINSKFESKK
ncbi:alpha-L-rhamnosidase C-terminal domain-containing protein, partial [uncultured Polaribacter sp.]|uniref:alpha-L-rhamnosidase C-terminal domain-containing protein n=1 Tax=uncultured Polaribacter sp. TaxID=174711 RepID=UPI00259B2636